MGTATVAHTSYAAQAHERATREEYYLQAWRWSVMLRTAPVNHRSIGGNMHGLEAEARGLDEDDDYEGDEEGGGNEEGGDALLVLTFDEREDVKRKIAMIGSKMPSKGRCEVEGCADGKAGRCWSMYRACEVCETMFHPRRSHMRACGGNCRCIKNRANRALRAGKPIRGPRLAALQRDYERGLAIQQIVIDALVKRADLHDTNATREKVAAENVRTQVGNLRAELATRRAPRLPDVAPEAHTAPCPACEHEVDTVERGTPTRSARVWIGHGHDGKVVEPKGNRPIGAGVLCDGSWRGIDTDPTRWLVDKPRKGIGDAKRDEPAAKAPRRSLAVPPAPKATPKPKPETCPVCKGSVITAMLAGHGQILVDAEVQTPAERERWAVAPPFFVLKDAIAGTMPDAFRAESEVGYPKHVHHGGLHHWWWCTKACGEGPWNDGTEPDACPCGGNLAFANAAPLGPSKWRGGDRTHGKPARGQRPR